MTREHIEAVVRQNICEVVEGARTLELHASQSLEELGADSLEIVEVVSRVMKQLNIRMRRSELARAANLGELCDLLESHSQA